VIAFFSSFSVFSVSSVAIHFDIRNSLFDIHNSLLDIVSVIAEPLRPK